MAFKCPRPRPRRDHAACEIQPSGTPVTGSWLHTSWALGPPGKLHHVEAGAWPLHLRSTPRPPSLDHEEGGDVGEGHDALHAVGGSIHHHQAAHAWDSQPLHDGAERVVRRADPDALLWAQVLRLRV